MFRPIALAILFVPLLVIACSGARSAQPVSPPCDDSDLLTSLRALRKQEAPPTRFQLETIQRLINELPDLPHGTQLEQSPSPAVNRRTRELLLAIALLDNRLAVSATRPGEPRFPVLNVYPPAGTNVIPGMSPDAIADPILRQEYEAKIAANRRLSREVAARQLAGQVQKLALGALGYHLAFNLPPNFNSMSYLNSIAKLEGAENILNVETYCKLRRMTNVSENEAGKIR